MSFCVAIFFKIALWIIHDVEFNTVILMIISLRKSFLRRIKHIFKQKKQRLPSYNSSLSTFREIKVTSKYKLSVLKTRQIFGFRVTLTAIVKLICKSWTKLEQMQTVFEQKIFPWNYNVELATYQLFLLPPSWSFLQFFFFTVYGLGGKSSIWRLMLKEGVKRGEHFYTTVNCYSCI